MVRNSRNNDFFPAAQPDDLCLTFRPYKPGELPLEYAAIKTEEAFEELSVCMTELGGGILVSVQAVRCGDMEIFRPLAQRGDEIAGYRKRGCTLRRNGDSNSNFFTVSTTGSGTVWIRNESGRSLRFQAPDGMLYRVRAGYTEALSDLNEEELPTQVLLELGGNTLDLAVNAVYVRYGEAPWQRGGVDCQSGAHVDSYFCRVFCGDDCLGVLESHSDYFLESPRLELLDITTYGPTQWFVRNRGGKELALTWPDGRTADAPADGQIYRLEALAANRGEEGK